MTIMLTCQWGSSHLDILNLSRGVRIRGGGRSWPETIYCRKYSEYKVFCGFFFVS